MNTLHDYQSNVRDLVQDALDFQRLLAMCKNRPEDLNLLLPDLEQRLKRISHLQPEETIEDVVGKLPLHQLELTERLFEEFAEQGNMLR